MGFTDRRTPAWRQYMYFTCISAVQQHKAVCGYVLTTIKLQLMGRRFNHDDPAMIHFKKTTRLFSRACSVVEGTELDLFPWLRFFPSQPFRLLREARDMLDTFVDNELERVKVWCTCRWRLKLNDLASVLISEHSRYGRQSLTVNYFSLIQSGIEPKPYELKPYALSSRLAKPIYTY